MSRPTTATPPSEPKETILIVVKTAAVPTIKADLRTLVLEGEVHPLTSEMLFDIHHKLERLIWDIQRKMPHYSFRGHDGRPRTS